MPSGARGGQPQCQVEGCAIPLPRATVYHQRYKICTVHATMPSMDLNGAVVRFCQQCGRFQPLDDFDGTRKTCRKKLQQHNAQRKRARDQARLDKATGQGDSDGSDSPQRHPRHSVDSSGRSSSGLRGPRATQSESKVALADGRSTAGTGRRRLVLRGGAASGSGGGGGGGSMPASPAAGTVVSTGATLSAPASMPSGPASSTLTLTALNLTEEPIDVADIEALLGGDDGAPGSTHAIASARLPPVVTLPEPWAGAPGSGWAVPVRQLQFTQPLIAVPTAVSHSASTLQESTVQALGLPLQLHPQQQIEQQRQRHPGSVSAEELYAASMRLFRVPPGQLPEPVLQSLISTLAASGVESWPKFP